MSRRANADSTALTLDDFARGDGVSSIGTRWSAFTDRVMGGRSVGVANVVSRAGRRCLRLTGEVSLENNGGFVQAALPLATGVPLDASGYAGLEFVAFGNNEGYALHLKTADLERPWQYYVADFEAPDVWRTVRIPFADFSPRATARPLDIQRLTRLGFVASGRVFRADLCIAAVHLYR